MVISLKIEPFHDYAKLLKVGNKLSLLKPATHTLSHTRPFHPSLILFMSVPYTHTHANKTLHSFPPSTPCVHHSKTLNTTIKITDIQIATILTANIIPVYPSFTQRHTRTHDLPLHPSFYFIRSLSDKMENTVKITAMLTTAILTARFYLLLQSHCDAVVVVPTMWRERGGVTQGLSSAFFVRMMRHIPSLISFCMSPAMQIRNVQSLETALPLVCVHRFSAQCCCMQVIASLDKYIYSAY